MQLQKAPQKICSVQMLANASIPKMECIPGLYLRLAANLVSIAANTVIAVPVATITIFATLFNGMTEKLQIPVHLVSSIILMGA